VNPLDHTMSLIDIDVVHNDPGAVGRESSCIRFAQASPTAGHHDRHAINGHEKLHLGPQAIGSNLS
jgi:hypothetical protein